MYPLPTWAPGKWEIPIFMGKLSPRIPREHNEYQGYTVRGYAQLSLECWSFRKNNCEFQVLKMFRMFLLKILGDN